MVKPGLQTGDRAIMEAEWVKGPGDRWYELREIPRLDIDDQGVYVIWHNGEPPAIIDVGQGDILERLTAHLRDATVLHYSETLTVNVTWAILPECAWDGVESFLADRYRLRGKQEGRRYPRAKHVPVTLPE